MSRLGQRAIDALRAYEKAEKATGFDPAPGPSRSRGSSRPRTTIPPARGRRSRRCVAPRAGWWPSWLAEGGFPLLRGCCSQLSAVLTGTKFAQLSWSVVTAGMNPSTPHHQEHRTHEQDRCLDRGGEQGTTLGRLYGIAETLCLTQKLYTSESH